MKWQLIIYFKSMTTGGRFQRYNKKVEVTKEQVQQLLPTYNLTKIARLLVAPNGPQEPKEDVL